MSRLGFAIDHRACIGCHACTVACKMENDVPLGTFRTWVKYIETGSFPDTRRYFSVLRCNHCDHAPCITICPTGALFRSGTNGIVDFNNAVCIGCKACMQACPYDALYLDPRTQTAAKCNFCAPRVEIGLEPACVIVCPTHAIISGDLDDPTSEIAQVVARNETDVRAPEQNTKPKVFYVGAHEAALDPTQVSQPEEYLWTEHNLLDGALQPRLAEANAKARTTYDVDHPMPWGWKVSAYLWTKSIAAGAGLVAALALLAGHAPNRLLGFMAPAIALAATAVTGVLLIADLKRPERFWMLLLRPNTRSWLVRGAWLLMAFGALLAAWLAAEMISRPEVIQLLAWPAIPIAALTAGYTGWLFGQAEGRDLWQSPFLGWGLVAQALLAGAAALCLTALFSDDTELIPLFSKALVGSALLWTIFTILELRHAARSTRQAQLALKNLLSGHYAGWFRTGVALGMVAPAALGALFLITAYSGMLFAASLAALVGLAAYEHGFVKAGQSVPLS